ERHWSAGQDVLHAELGPGWVQGSGVGRVTVRFEVPGSAPGRVRTFRVDDEALRPAEPLPLVGAPAEDAGGTGGAAPAEDAGGTGGAAPAEEARGTGGAALAEGRD
ncbi:DNA polymerase IV, partial [Streptomyces zhihengii]